MWFLVLILIRAILEQSINNKMVSKIKLECLLLIYIYTNAKFIVICKPRTFNDGGEDSVEYRNRKNHCFLAAAILLFMGKIIITWYTLGSRGEFVAISVLLNQPRFYCCTCQRISEKLGWSIWIRLTFSVEGAFQNGRQIDYLWPYLSSWGS